MDAKLVLNFMKAAAAAVCYEQNFPINRIYADVSFGNSCIYVVETRDSFFAGITSTSKYLCLSLLFY